MECTCFITSYSPVSDLALGSTSRKGFNSKAVAVAAAVAPFFAWTLAFA
jgi:hypothetical protein